MKYLISCLMLFGAQCFANTNLCHFKGGKAEITYKGKKASVKVNIANHGPTYHNCKVTSDEFGKLVDCNTGNRDFMILISKDSKSNAGGIMSNTLNLFKDINC